MRSGRHQLHGDLLGPVFRLVVIPDLILNHRIVEVEIAAVRIIVLEQVKPDGGLAGDLLGVLVAAVADLDLLAGGDGPRVALDHAENVVVVAVVFRALGHHAVLHAEDVALKITLRDVADITVGQMPVDDPERLLVVLVRQRIILHALIEPERGETESAVAHRAVADVNESEVQPLGEYAQFVTLVGGDIRRELLPGVENPAALRPDLGIGNRDHFAVLHPVKGAVAERQPILFRRGIGVEPEFAEKLALAAAAVAEKREPDLRLVEIARTRRPVDHQVGALEKVVAPDVIGLFGKIDAVDGRHNPGADRIHIGGAGLRAGPGSGRDRQVPHLVTFHLALRHDIQPFNVLRHVERGRNRRKTRQCRLFHKRLPIVGIPEIDRIILAGNLGSDIHRHGRPVVESPGILFIKFGIVDILVDTRRGRQCREHECQSGNVHGSNV